MTPQECRAAHGPRHPLMNIPLGLCRGLCQFVVRLFRSFFALMLRLLFLRGRYVAGCFKLQAPTRVWIIVSVPLLISLFGTFADAVSQFFFSFSGAGETQARVVWVSPCVSSSWLRTTSSTRTSSPSPTPRSCPAPVVFFFVVVDRVGFFVWFSHLVLLGCFVRWVFFCTCNA